MSSPNGSRRHVLRGALVLSATASLGGCFTPLYGPAQLGGPGITTQALLAGVDVIPIGGRIGTQLRNELIYLLSQGSGRPASPTHTLWVVVSADSVPLLLDTGVGRVTAQSMNLATTFYLRAAGTNEQQLVGRAASTTSIDRNIQRLAADRALLDAQERASKQLAEQIVNQLAIHFAARR